MSVFPYYMPGAFLTGTAPTILYVRPDPAANWMDVYVAVGWTRVLVYILDSTGSEVLKFDSDSDPYGLTVDGDLIGRISTDADSLPFRKGRAYVIRPKEDPGGGAGPDRPVLFPAGSSRMRFRARVR
jgi:hypothetical protein